MTAAWGSIPSFSKAWMVLALFLIPIGGGIPAGVLMARSLSIPWPVTAVLYLISDVILACLFEPILLAAASASKRVARLDRFKEAFRKAMKKTAPRFGSNARPLGLVLIAFGADPMTGRVATAAAGHGFMAGWALAIAGDMLYFGLLMVSTLWLNGILGDGTWTTIIILAVMILVPWAVRRFRERKNR